MLGIDLKTDGFLVTALAIASLVLPFFYLVTPAELSWVWWAFVGAVCALTIISLILAIRERRLRHATERVIGRKLVNAEPIVSAWLKWARQIRDQLRIATRERLDIEVVLENMGEGIVVLNEHQQIHRINAAAERLLKLKREQIVGQHYRQAIPQQDLVRFIGTILSEGNRAEVDLTLAESDTRYLQASGQLLISEAQGATAGMVVVLNEVTRLRRLERARRDFVANVSHELKTPITSIQGFVETLLDGAVDSREDTLKFLGIIQRQSDRLGQIFNDMLTLSRIETEHDLEATSTDLYSLARNVVASLEWRARERKVELQLEGSPTPVIVNGQLIEQALSNLVDNAIKYGADSKHGRVKVVVGTKDGQACVSVEDNGAGIAAQHLPRIFERFYRVDKGRSRTEGGTGLGLSIVKHIAQAHGGYATVESEPGVRTIFEISLPVQKSLPNNPN